MDFSFNEYLFFAACYLIGSIPFGIIVAKLAGVKDLTKHGSGNIGATNVVRVVGKKLGALTFLLDFSKGLICVIIYKSQFDSLDGQLICALCAILGHIFSIFNKFKGGKGVATGFGVLVALSPLLGLVTILLWVAFFAVTRISSASALFSYSMMPFIYILFGKGTMSFMAFAICLSLIIFATHLKNIQRLLNGQEKTIK